MKKKQSAELFLEKVPLALKTAVMEYSMLLRRI